MNEDNSSFLIALIARRETANAELVEARRLVVEHEIKVRKMAHYVSVLDAVIRGENGTADLPVTSPNRDKNSFGSTLLSAIMQALSVDKPLTVAEVADLVEPHVTFNTKRNLSQNVRNALTEEEKKGGVIAVRIKRNLIQYRLP